MTRLDLSVSIAGIQMKNPIMPASGTFAEEMAEIIDLNTLGALVTKSVTKSPRMGNKGPRMAETTAGMINAVGIQSKGADALCKNSVPFYAQFASPLIVSISADTAEDFAALAAQVSVPGVAALEVNISCPNLEDDGRSYAMDPHQTHRVISLVRKSTSLPIFAKLTPNANAIADIGLAAEHAGADALVVANTLLAMSINISTRRPSVGNVMGGLSGPCIKPVIVRMVYQTYKKVNIPIIGCGGICSVEDVIEYMLAGASAVQIGTYNFVNPTGMAQIIQDLEEYAIKNGISKITDLVGAVQDDSRDFTGEALAF